MKKTDYSCAVKRLKKGMAFEQVFNLQPHDNTKFRNLISLNS